MSYYMPSEGVDLVSQIETRICKLQEDHISLQEKFKEDQNSVGRNLDDSALRMIEILELIDMSKSNMDLGSEGPLIINKIVKRISDIFNYIFDKYIVTFKVYIIVLNVYCILYSTV